MITRCEPPHYAVSSASRYFFVYTIKYSPQRPVFEHHQSMFFRRVRDYSIIHHHPPIRCCPTPAVKKLLLNIPRNKCLYMRPKKKRGSNRVITSINFVNYYLLVTLSFPVGAARGQSSMSCWIPWLFSQDGCYDNTEIPA